MVLQECADAYRRRVKVMPRTTNTIISTFLSSTADAVVQALEAARATRAHRLDVPRFDFRRNSSLAVTSGLWNGLVLSQWLIMLERWCPKKNWKSVIAKVGATQGVLNACIYMPFFYLVHGELAGQGIGEAVHHYEEEHIQLLIRLWAIYIPAYVIMFALIPVEYQVLWISGVSLFWNMILSVFSHKKPASEGIVSLMMELDEFGGDPVAGMGIGEVVSAMDPFGSPRLGSSGAGKRSAGFRSDRDSLWP